MEDRILEGQFRFHIDTENLRKNIHKILPETWVSISDKWHGTSAVYANILVKRELNWLERLLKRIGVKIADTEYGYTWSSRAARNLGHPVIFVSGRDEGKTRQLTEEWLRIHWGCDYTLLMRPADDTRRDSIIKKELYENHIKGKYNVVAVFEDRLRVAQAWDELGLGDRLFRVGPVGRDDF